MEMTTQRWEYTQNYAQEVFGRQDDHLAQLQARAAEAGLPDIAVSPDVGRLLKILTSRTRGRLAIEVGTLGGYSGIWIARGLSPGGRLITIEPNETHAAFAREQFKLAGVSDRVELRLGTGLDVLAQLRSELPPGSVDGVFLDAIKEEYPDYWTLVRPLIAEGGVIMADNTLGSGWWIDEERDATRAIVDRFNRSIADDPEFEASIVPLRSGVLFAFRNSGQV